MSAKHIKFFSKKENRKKRVIKLKGGLEITLPTKDYSVKDLRELREEGGLIHLYRNGLEISSFGNGVAGETITRYASGYEFDLQRRIKKMKLRKYCKASASYCEISDWNCDNCKLYYKDDALERKRKGKKVVRSRGKKIDFVKVVEERNVLQEKRNSKNKEISPKKSFTGGWIKR